MTLLPLSLQVGYFECKSIRTKAHALIGFIEKLIDRNATLKHFLFKSTQAIPIKNIAISSSARRKEAIKESLYVISSPFSHQSLTNRIRFNDPTAGAAEIFLLIASALFIILVRIQWQPT